MDTQHPQLEPLRPAYRVQYLTNEQLDQLQEATLDIMETVGVKFPSEKALEILDGHGAKVDKATQVVKFPRDLVFKAMKSIPRYFMMGARAPEYDLQLEDGVTYFTTDGCGVQVMELDSQTERASRKSDVGVSRNTNDGAHAIALDPDEAIFHLGVSIGVDFLGEAGQRGQNG